MKFISVTMLGALLMTGTACESDYDEFDQTREPSNVTAPATDDDFARPDLDPGGTTVQASQDEILTLRDEVMRLESEVARRGEEVASRMEGTLEDLHDNLKEAEDDLVAVQRGAGGDAAEELRTALDDLRSAIGEAWLELDKD